MADTGFIEVAGRKIFHRYDGKGYPVILVHGSHRSSYVWSRNIESLAKHFAVFAPDRPGYGNSDPINSSETLPDMSEFLRQYVAALGVETAHFIGESRGGGICIELATSAPRIVNKLVLVSPVGLPPNELPKPLEVSTKSRWEWFVERSFHDASILPNDMRNIVLDNLAKAENYEQRRLASVSREYNRTGLLERLVRLDRPTLLVWGRQDPVFPVECFERFRQLIQSLAGVYIIDNARHLVFYEHADLFNEHVLNFFLR